LLVQTLGQPSYIRQYMNVEVTKLPESRVALKIELTAEEAGQALDRTYKQLVQRVNVPGFRKERRRDQSSSVWWEQSYSSMRPRTRLCGGRIARPSIKKISPHR
jgi:hypothetical protein